MPSVDACARAGAFLSSGALESAGGTRQADACSINPPMHPLQWRHLRLASFESIVRALNIPTLIKMKEAAGREQDRIDIEHLRMRLNDDAGQ